MTAFAITALTSLFALVISAVFSKDLLARLSSPRPSSASGFAAARAASSAFLRLSLQILAAVGLLAAFLVFIGYGVVRASQATDAITNPYVMAGWMAAALALGTASTFAAGFLPTWASLRYRLRTGGLTMRPDALRATVRASFAGALPAIAVPLLCLIAIGAASFGQAGGFSSGAPLARPLAAMSLLAPCFGLGAALGALFFHLLGGGYAAAAAIADGALAARDAPPSPTGSDLRRIAAHHLEQTTSGSVGLTTTISVGLALGLPLTVGSVQANASHLLVGPGTALFPLLVVSFGIVAAIVGLMVVRADVADDAVRPLERGLLVTVVLSLASIVGLTRWLFDIHWLGLFLSCATGLAASLVLSLVVRGYEHRASKMPPASAEPTVMRDLGAGFARAVTVLAVAAAMLASGYFIGLGSGLERGGVLGLVASVLGMLSLGPYLVAASASTTLAAPLHASARTAGSSRTAHAVVRAYASLATIAVCTLAVPAYPHIVESFGRTIDSSGSPLVSVLTALGGIVVAVVLVLWFVSLRLQATVRAALASDERAGQADSALAVADGLMQHALRTSLTTGMVVMALPAAVGVAQWALVARLGPGAAAGASLALISAVVWLGGGMAAVFDGWAACSAAADKESDASKKVKTQVDGGGKRANNRHHGAAVVSDTLADPLSHLAGPSLHALVKLLATATVALAPLFH